MNRTTRPMIAGAIILTAAATPLLGDNAVPDRPPAAPTLKPPAMPVPFTARLENGMEIVVVSDDKLPYVTVGWQLLAGAKFDPKDKPGVASLTAELLREGTKKHTSDEFAERLDFLAINFTVRTEHEYTSVYVGALSRYLESAVALLADAVRNPIFPQDEFDRKVTEVKSALSIAERDPDYHAQREFDRRVFGEHYLSRPTEGTTDSLGRIKRRGVIAFHKTYYVPNHSTLIFSGAIRPEQALTLAKKHFGNWPKGTLPPEPSGGIPELAATRIYLVDWPDASQSQIIVGHRGIKRTDPSYETAQVFNQILAGGFAGRLVKSIRAEKGLTYGGRGGFFAYKHGGVFLAQTFTRNEKTAETLRIILREVNRIRQEPVTEKELNDARNYLIGRFGLNMETPRQVADRILRRRFYELPEDYYEKYLAKIEAAAADDVLRVASDKLHPDNLVIVVVGRTDQIKESLKTIAPVTVIRQSQEGT